jgi:hypothetical protein
MAEEERRTGAPRRPRGASAAKRGDRSPEGGSQGRGGGRGRDDGGYDNGGERDEVEAVEAHAEFVERHFGGGAPATAELLDRANEVWVRLPGAVVQGAAQLRPNRPEPPSTPPRAGRGEVA